MSKMHRKATIAVIGCGDFSPHFIPLFKAHPYTEKVYVCDRVPEKAEKCSKDYGVESIGSFEQALERQDITAVAIFTERHTHGPLVKAALKAGKDVYSAVPMAGEVEECLEIVDIVKNSDLIYMMGETCVYYPCSMYCKKEHEKGAFGDFVFGESQYFHDLSHFSEHYRNSPDGAGLPPFLYPTHSTAMILHAKVGEKVFAGANGIVRDIQESAKTGQTIQVDLGNGYEAFYGQLKDVQVGIGDYVKADTILGYINEPSKYFTEEGANLYLEIHKDGQPINPLDILE